MWTLPPARYSLTQVWFAAVTLYALAPFSVVMAARARHQGVLWDFAMALGLAAAVGLALLPLVSARWWVAQYADRAFLRMVQRVHRDLAYVAATFIAVHVALLLYLEPRTIEYLKLGASPAMLAGLVALLIVIALLLSSPRSRQSRLTYRTWRQWHAWLSLAAIALILWHVVGAGYFHHTSGQRMSALWLFCIPTLLTWQLRRKSWSRPVLHHAAPAYAPPIRIVLAIALSWLAASSWFALSGAGEQMLEERPLCPIDPCL